MITINNTAEEDIKSSCKSLGHLTLKSDIASRKEYYKTFFNTIKDDDSFTYDSKFTLFDVLMLCRKHRISIDNDKAKESNLSKEFIIDVIKSNFNK
jgi:hypothetical protein